MLDPIQSLFSDGEDDLAILHNGGRGVRVKHV